MLFIPSAPEDSLPARPVPTTGGDWGLRHRSPGTFSPSVASGSWEDTDVDEFGGPREGTSLYPTMSSVMAGSAAQLLPSTWLVLGSGRRHTVLGEVSGLMVCSCRGWLAI